MQTNMQRIIPCLIGLFECCGAFCLFAQLIVAFYRKLNIAESAMELTPLNAEVLDDIVKPVMP